MTEYGIPTTWEPPKGFDIELSGGSKVLARALQVEDVIEMDLMDELDYFSGVAGKGQKKKGVKKTPEEFDVGSEAFVKMIDVINRVVCRAVLKPTVKALPEDGQLEEGVAYITHVPYIDRMTIFTKVFTEQMGGEEFEKFRAQSIAGVGALSKEQVVQLPAKPDDGDGKKPTESVLPG